MNTKLTAAAFAAIAMISSTADAEVKVSTKGGLKIESGDYNRSELNGEVDEDDFDARRARLFVKGNVGEDWGYKINWNVDGDGFEDLYLRYSGWGKGSVVTIGNQHQPFTLSQLISSKDVGISERPGIVERYLIGRREGVQLHGDIDKLHYAVGVFTEEGTDEDNGLAILTPTRLATKVSWILTGIMYKQVM